MKEYTYPLDYIKDVALGNESGKALEYEGNSVYYCVGKDQTFADKIATKLRKMGIYAHYCRYSTAAFGCYQHFENGEINRRKFVGRDDLRYARFEDMPEDSFFVYCNILNPADFFALAHTSYWRIGEIGEYRDCARKEKQKLESYMGNIVLTNKSGNVYYAYDYKAPKYYGRSQEAQMVWDYKAGYILDGTDRLMQLISRISQKDENKNIALVAIPPSEVGKISPVRESIKMIREWYENNTAYQVYGCDKVIYDCGDMLVRTKDVRSAHKQRCAKDRPTMQEHLASIGFNGKPELFKEDVTFENTTFIIMDDVYTTGTQSSACEKILYDNGISTRNIKKVMLSKTVSSYYGYGCA